jgi:DNA-binding transcriptional MerR regulator
MDALLGIGQFSKMTYLSVKALRHYHDVGLLEPAAVDPATGYRQYSVGQVGTAQAIRRFRDLEMPIEEVRRVLRAPDEASRNRAILAHLERMHRQLDQTRAAVASLQALLAPGPGPDAPVVIRRLPAIRAAVTRAEVGFEDCGDWLTPALHGLRRAAEAAGLAVTGPDGALYPDEFFEAGRGEVTAFVPVAGDAESASAVELPATTVAVLVHDGPFDDLDRAYGALGTAVAEMGVIGPGPIREHYLDRGRTEVCWPVAGAG